jgi:NAD(P)-dependent dehydrogenase (short-subunit alcohol dehydrogenase family)
MPLPVGVQYGVENRILPRSQCAGTRICKTQGIDWSVTCRGEKKTTSDMQVYGTSKIYLIMASKALNEKLKGTGVEVFAAHPGDSFPDKGDVMRASFMTALGLYGITVTAAHTSCVSNGC